MRQRNDPDDRESHDQQTEREIAHGRPPDLAQRLTERPRDPERQPETSCRVTTTQSPTRRGLPASGGAAARAASRASHASTDRACTARRGGRSRTESLPARTWRASGSRPAYRSMFRRARARPTIFPLRFTSTATSCPSSWAPASGGTAGFAVVAVCAIAAAAAFMRASFIARGRLLARHARLNRLPYHVAQLRLKLRIELTDARVLPGRRLSSRRCAGRSRRTAEASAVWAHDPVPREHQAAAEPGARSAVKEPVPARIRVWIWLRIRIRRFRLKLDFVDERGGIAEHREPRPHVLRAGVFARGLAIGHVEQTIHPPARRRR